MITFPYNTHEEWKEAIEATEEALEDKWRPAAKTESAGRADNLCELCATYSECHNCPLSFLNAELNSDDTYGNCTERESPWKVWSKMSTAFWIAEVNDYHQAKLNAEFTSVLESLLELLQLAFTAWKLK